MLGFAVVHSQSEQVLGISAFVFALMLMAAGILAYFLNTLLKPRGWGIPEERSTASL